MEALRARLDRRLDELAAARPDLARALELQRALLRRQIDLLELFQQAGVPGVRLPPRYLAAKLKKGVPALYGEPVPLPMTVLELSTREFCGLLAEGGAQPAADVAQAIERRALDGPKLISACFGRDQRLVRFMTAQGGLSPDIAWLAAELAVAPLAHLLQVQALSRPEAAAPIRAWDRGYCPACGSWPAVAEAVAGRHTLRCSFCAAAWELGSYRCIYCSNGDETFITAAPRVEEPGRRIQMCHTCGGYLKVIDLLAPTEFPLVAIEDLASMELDLLAVERKYMRPALPEIRKAVGSRQ